MARPVNNGWDFVKEGMILQYKEDWYIAIVEVVEDLSTDKSYSFVLRPIAANTNDIDAPFTVGASKKNKAIYSGMSQFYKHPEYMPLPIGAEWPFIYDMDVLNTTKFIWKHYERE